MTKPAMKTRIPIPAALSALCLSALVALSDTAAPSPTALGQMSPTSTVYTASQVDAVISNALAEIDIPTADLSDYATTGAVASAVQTASTNFLPLAGGTMTGALLFDSPGSTVLSGDLSGALPFDIMAAGSVPATQATLSGSLWAYGHDYARDEDIERQVAPSNLVCTYREAGSATFSCDWLDASTGEPVGSGGHLFLSAYDYGGGYVEVSLSGGASLPDGYLECSGYASLASRAPGLSGRAATTDELGAVASTASSAASTASSAYSLASGKASASDISSAIASHNADASAHAAAIQSAASSAVGRHNASLNAHSFAHRLSYIDNVGRYIAGNSSSSVTGTPCDYIVETTEDSADFTHHGGDFNLEIGALKPANVADGLRRFANIVVLVTGVLPDDPSAAIPARAYKPLIRTILVNDVKAFDCGSCATPIRAVMLRVAAFPGTDARCLQILETKCITPQANGVSEYARNADKIFVGSEARPSVEFRFDLVASTSSSTAFDPVDITIPGLWVGYAGSFVPSSGCDRIPTFNVFSANNPYLAGSRTTVMVCRTGAGMSEAKFKYSSNTITIPLPAFPSGATRDWFRFEVSVPNINRMAVKAYTSSTANGYYNPL